MTCSCREHTLPGPDLPHRHSRLVPPTEPCLFCAEKHLSAAAALARETGYAAPNRQFVVGELVCAAWHLALDHPDLASRIRDLRHDIQASLSPAPDFAPLLLALDTLLRPLSPPT